MITCHNTCDVCGKTDETVFVLCSSLGAMSFAYCKDCAQKGLEPYWAIVTTASILQYPTGCAEWFLNLIDLTLENLHISKEQFMEDVLEAYNEMDILDF